jgi:hypothetical protein
MSARDVWGGDKTAEELVAACGEQLWPLRRVMLLLSKFNKKGEETFKTMRDTVADLTKWRVSELRSENVELVKVVRRLEEQTRQTHKLISAHRPRRAPLPAPAAPRAATWCVRADGRCLGGVGVVRARAWIPDAPSDSGCQMLPPLIKN